MSWFVLVAFQHIPFFIDDPEEDDQYFNVPKERRFKYLDKLREVGVKHIFCGHFHKNAGGRYKDLELVITSAIGAPLGNDPSGYREVNVEEDNIKHRYVTIKDTIEFK